MENNTTQNHITILYPDVPHRTKTQNPTQFSLPQNQAVQERISPLPFKNNPTQNKPPLNKKTLSENQEKKRRGAWKLSMWLGAKRCLAGTVLSAWRPQLLPVGDTRQTAGVLEGEAHAKTTGWACTTALVESLRGMCSLTVTSRYRDATLGGDGCE